MPATAPLSIGRFDRVLIAASSHLGALNQVDKPRATVPELDEMIQWADVQVKHDGYMEKADKIFGAIAEYLEEEPLTLRVCKRSRLLNGEVNDSTCEKCLRTIAPLVLLGHDPNKMGFHVDESTFPDLKQFWLKMKTPGSSRDWRKLQALIPEVIEKDLYGSREFFEWFRDFDFKSTEYNWFYTDLYMSLPYKLARLLDKYYQRKNIDVHKGPYRRDR